MADAGGELLKARGYYANCSFFLCVAGNYLFPDAGWLRKQPAIDGLDQYRFFGKAV
jgi:hypothetical protein